MKAMFGLNYIDSLNFEQKIVRNFAAYIVAMCMGESDGTNSVSYWKIITRMELPFIACFNCEFHFRHYCLLLSDIYQIGLVSISY